MKKNYISFGLVLLVAAIVFGSVGVSEAAFFNGHEYQLFITTYNISWDEGETMSPHWDRDGISQRLLPNQRMTLWQI